MSNKLENRLSEIEKLSPIKNDADLASALRSIIEEESRDICEDNADLISDATELLLSIEGTGENEINERSADSLSKFMKETKTCTAKTARKTLKNWRSFTAMRKVAVFAIMTVSAAVLLLSFNSEVRATVKDTFVTWMRELAIIDFSDEKSIETVIESDNLKFKDVNSVKISSIPSGYVFESKNADGDSLLYTYKKGDDFVVVELIPTDPAGVIHSTENHKYSEIAIGKSEGYMFYNEDERTGSIVFGNSNVTVIVGGIAERYVLVEFAEAFAEG